MAINQLIPLIKSLSHHDITYCRRFIASPYYNKSNNRKNLLQDQKLQDELLVELFDLLVAKKNEFNANKTYRDDKILEILFDNPNGNNDFYTRKAGIGSYGNFPLLKSHLVDLIEQYLVQTMLEKDEIQQKFYLLKALNEKNLTTAFEQTFQAARRIEVETEKIKRPEDKVSKKENKSSKSNKKRELSIENTVDSASEKEKLCWNEDYFVYMSKIYMEYHYMIIQYYRTKTLYYDISIIYVSFGTILSKLKIEFNKLGTFQNTNERKKTIQQVLNDTQMILDGIKIHIEGLNAQKGISSEEKIIDELKTEVFNSFCNFIKPYELCLNIYANFNDTKDEIFYKELKEIIFSKKTNKLLNSTIKNLCDTVRVFCMKKYMNNNKAYLAEIYGWFKFQEKEGYLLENGVLTIFIYKNMVTSGAQLQKFDEVEKFIKEYTSNLEHQYQEIYKQYGKIILDLRKGNYKNLLYSLKNLPKFNDPLLLLETRRFQIIAYYELDDNNFLTHLDSFNTYINRNKAKIKEGIHKTGTLNFINYTKRIFTIQGLSKSEKEELRNTIVNEKIIAEKEWLLSKLA